MSAHFILRGTAAGDIIGVVKGLTASPGDVLSEVLQVERARALSRRMMSQHTTQWPVDVSAEGGEPRDERRGERVDAALQRPPHDGEGFHVV